MKAATTKTILFLSIASAMFVCVPALASSHCALHLKTRAELKTDSGQNRIGQPTLTSITASSYYDSFGKVASDSSVAPNTGLPASLRNLKPGDPIPDGLEIVVRGSSNKPGTFILREIDNQPLGPVTSPGKSATVATDLSLETEIANMFGRSPKRGDLLSGGAIDDIRAAGFDVICAPTTKNPLHVRIVPKANQFDDVGRDWLSEAFDIIGRQRK